MTSSISRLLKTKKFKRGFSGQTSWHRQTAKCPHAWKHCLGKRCGSASRGPAPNSQHRTWHITERQAFVSHLLFASYERICSWNALRACPISWRKNSWYEEISHYRPLYKSSIVTMSLSYTVFKLLLASILTVAKCTFWLFIKSAVSN